MCRVLSAVMLDVIKPSVVIINDVMLSVMSPLHWLLGRSDSKLEQFYFYLVIQGSKVSTTSLHIRPLQLFRLRQCKRHLKLRRSRETRFNQFFGILLIFLLLFCFFDKIWSISWKRPTWESADTFKTPNCRRNLDLGLIS
jgi:hypothetical protein